MVFILLSSSKKVWSRRRSWVAIDCEMRLHVVTVDFLDLRRKTLPLLQSGTHFFRLLMIQKHRGTKRRKTSNASSGLIHITVTLHQMTN
jgi:hypothetical protein